MRPWSIAAAAAFPLLVLGWMAGQREWVLRTCPTIWLRTAPIDPRDPFRGDYVRLEYEISRLPREALRGALKDEDPDRFRKLRDRAVYVALKPSSERIAELLYASDQPPEDGPFIRGRLDASYAVQELPVRYGLEAMFVEQGRGLEIEQARNRGGIQVPMEVEAAVSPAGLAVLKSWRWSPLGIALAIEPLPRLPPGAPPPPGALPTTAPRPFRATLRLLNASERPLALVDLPDHGSLVLKPIRGAGARWQPARVRAAPPAPSDDQVRVLEPGQIHEVKLDLSEPRWAIRSPAGETRSLGGLEGGEWFRLVYQPPSEEECRGLRHAALIWHGRLESRAFNGSRSTD